MTGVFRHGRLRLYLLKLLEEAPRHGYEVIRLLQDRFLGVYSPSPGTIYPRLARLEAEGLVTRDESNGKKVYRITDKGRQELRNKFEELRILEEELAASARDIALEIGRDVRDTVRSLREELGKGVREPGEPRQAGTRGSWPGTGGWAGAAAFTGHQSPFRSSRDPRPGPDQAQQPGGMPGVPWSDLERLATDFVKDVTNAAARARSGLDETGMRDLRGILADTLGRISSEVFSPGGSAAQPPSGERTADKQPADEQPQERQSRDTDAPPTA